MNVIMSILLYVITNQGHSYILVLGVGSILLCLLIVTIFVQKQAGQRMKAEFKSLSQMKRHGVEYELVLKAMKLATWRLDVVNKTVTYDFDYRDRTDLYIPNPGTPVSQTFNFVYSDDKEHVRKALEDICTGKVDDYYQQYRVRLPHTDYVLWEESYATIAERGADGKPLSIVGTSSCIDDKKRLEHELIDARNKAEESDLLKSAFIANISHEVRTPLNAIVGFSEVLTSITDKTEQQNLISIIKENNDKLLRIFQDMMDMSKVEAHKDNDVLDITEFDIVEVLNYVVADFVAQNKKPAVEIRGQIQGDKLIVRTDRNRLVQVIDHFMDNAVKFTEVGNITLRLSYNAGTLTISVSDTGCGIPEKMRDRIFDRFIKLDTFVQGAGLGLSVCRSYTYSLGGIIGVDSEEGIGSTFWIKIPERI